jgi:hypothetical protein
VSARESELLTAALAYAARGWYVFPLRAGTKNGPLVATNHLAATADAEQIRKWWRKWPHANVGVALKPSQLVVVDSDVPKNGEASSKALIRTLNLPATLRARTATGGTHLYFEAGDHDAIGRLIRLARDQEGRKVALDVLGDGYVVAPPSHRKDTGKSYGWRNAGEDPAPLPASVRRLVAASRAPNSPSGRPRMTKLPDVIREGERDVMLTSLAGTMRKRGASERAILAALREENATRCELPLDDKQV